MVAFCAIVCQSRRRKESVLAVPRLHVMLKREILVFNHERTERLSGRRDGIEKE
jgi:hypothetical protein